MISTNRILPLVCALLALGLALAVVPDTRAEELGSNIRITFTLGRIEGKKKMVQKSFALVVTSGGPSASLLTGQRVPIPTTTDADDDSVRSYIYQNVGLSAEVQALITEAGVIELQSIVENSWIDPETAKGQPTIETRHQEARVVLKDGVPLELARSSDGDQVRYVEVQADILD